MYILKRWLSAVTLAIVVASLASGPAVTSAASSHSQTHAAPWRTWLLSSPSELRVGSPPGAADTLIELDQLRAQADERDAAALDRIIYWNAGAAPYRWMQRASKYGQSHGVTGIRATRMSALMSAA